MDHDQRQAERDEEDRKQLVVVAERPLGGQADERVGTEGGGEQRQLDRQPVHVAATEEEVVVVLLLVREEQAQPDDQGQIAATDGPVDGRNRVHLGSSC